jgi:voltage-gated potassium channel
VLRVIRSIREWKYMALLAALVLLATLEPLSVNWPESARIAGNAVVVGINVGILLVVFEERWQRRLAVLLLTFLIAANIVYEVSSHRLQIAAIIYHCVGAVFLAFAVAAILKRIFQRQAIRTDDVIGSLCGYILAAAAWGNAYALVYTLWPESFRVADTITPRLGDWHLQRLIFDYFSVMTLTTLGYDDIIPRGPPAYSLMWLEAVFGQFYIAVVVAQLIGLRLARVIKGTSGENEK